MFTFAHLSDIHLAPLPSAPPGMLLGKRLTGYASWRLNRHRLHRPETLALVLGDLARQSVDHLCVTGDLVNLALPAEILRATGWLNARGTTDRLSLVPGNHDAYTPAAASMALQAWRPWMAESFPYVHRVGPLVFIGLSTAVPTPPFFASGRLGEAQMGRLEAILAEQKENGAIRIVLLHHPPQPGVTTARKGLDDAAAFRSLIERQGAELVLHGHLHRPVQTILDGPRGGVPVFGAGSASLTKDGGGGAQYYMFGIDGQNLHVRSRLLMPTGVFAETASTIALPV